MKLLSVSSRQAGANATHVLDASYRIAYTSAAAQERDLKETPI
jgi:hypothetical protein